MPEPTFSLTRHNSDDASEGAGAAFGTGEAGLSWSEMAAAGPTEDGSQPASGVGDDGFIQDDPEEAIRRAAATAVCDAASYLHKTRTMAEAALALAMTRLETDGDAAAARDLALAGQEAMTGAAQTLATVSDAAEALLSGLFEASVPAPQPEMQSDAELDIQADR